MASSSMNGGYDYDFVESPPDELICLICHLVARDPQQIQCCGRIFCKACLSNHNKRSDLCPQCRREATSFADVRSKRQISNMRMRCGNRLNGCEWTDELHLYDTHVSKCSYAVVPCPYKCSGGLPILRMDLDNHLTECPSRKYRCPYCKEERGYEERTTTHLDKCPKVKVRCPNAKCKVTVTRTRLSHHQEICKHEIAECKYAMIGCKTKLPRKDMSEHENNAQCHLQEAVETVLDLKEALLKQQCAQSKIFKFMVANFENLKQSCETFYSPPFYTHPSGYKMCINVDMNGDGDGNGTHISVFAKLMRGVNDDNLPWPFTGAITVTLLNQLEDRKHHMTTTTFPADSDCSKRVVNSEMGRGYGRPKYIPQTDLHYDSSRNCQYLKDDTLYFQVSVELDGLKPWLMC